MGYASAEDGDCFTEEAMSTQNEYPDWAERLRTRQPDLAAADAFFGIFGMTRAEEEKPDPSNYRGVNWSEVG
jgi:hypothetical protein